MASGPPGACPATRRVSGAIGGNSLLRSDCRPFETPPSAAPQGEDARRSVSHSKSGLAAVEFEAGPVGVYGADFHVDEAHRQAELADAVFGKIDEEL